MGRFRLGDRVKVVTAGESSSNEDGDVGTITQVNPGSNTVRVTVEGRDNFGNWQLEFELELL